MKDSTMPIKLNSSMPIAASRFKRPTNRSRVGEFLNSSHDCGSELYQSNKTCTNMALTETSSATPKKLHASPHHAGNVYIYIILLKMTKCLCTWYQISFVIFCLTKYNFCGEIQGYHWPLSSYNQHCYYNFILTLRVNQGHVQLASKIGKCSRAAISHHLTQTSKKGD